MPQGITIPPEDISSVMLTAYNQSGRSGGFYMRTLLTGIFLFAVMTVCGGVVKPPDGRTFRLPSNAASGGTVTAELNSEKPLCIRLNGKILGYFKPEGGIIKADLTPAVWYAAENTVECRPDAVLTSVSYEDAVSEPAVVTKLRREKVRMNSSAAQPASRAEELHGTGFNMVMGWSGIHRGVKSNDPGSGEALVSANNMPRLRFLRDEVTVAKAHGLIPIPLMWYHEETQQLMDQTAYEKCRSVGYGVQKTPCPLDSVYWDRLVKPTLKIVAGVYKEFDAPGGMMLDQEFYAGGYPGFTYGGAEDGCYCDSCMKQFFEAVGEDVDLSKAEKRLEYIIRRGYTLEDYQGVLEVRLARKLRGIMQEVRSVKADFLVGLMPGMGNWYTNGVARGMATPGMPVLITGEGEYFRGYNQHSRENQEKLGKWGWPALYLPGLVISSYNAEGLGTKAVEAAQQADGYWLYYGEMFFAKNPRIITDGINPSEYALRESAERYLAAMKKANAYLEKHPAPPAPPTAYAPFPEFDSTDFKITADGITFSDAAAVPANLLTAKPQYAKGITTSSEGGVIFNMEKQGSNGCFQAVAVEPGRKYRMTLNAKASGLSLPVAGFRILEGEKIIAQSVLGCDGSPDWTELTKVFTPTTDTIKVKLLAYGETGIFEFKDAHLAPVVPFRVTSARLPGNTNALKLQIGRKIYAELVNPVTELAYFRLIDGVNDLRLLREIYGDLPQTVRFSGDISGNVSFAK